MKSTNQKPPVKPRHFTWVASAGFVCMGLWNLYQFVSQGYVQLTKLGYYVQYTGSLAIATIAVPVGIGLYGLVISLRAWQVYRKGLRDERTSG